MVDPGIVRSTLCGAPSQRRPKSLDHEAQDLMRNTRRAVGQMGAHKSWRYLALRSVPGHSWLGASDERPWDYLRAGFAKRGGAAVVFYSRTGLGPWIVFWTRDVVRDDEDLLVSTETKMIVYDRWGLTSVLHWTAR